MAKYRIEDTQPDPVVEQIPVQVVPKENVQMRGHHIRRPYEDREMRLSSRLQEEEIEDDEEGEEEDLDFIDDGPVDGDEGEEEDGEEEDDEDDQSVGVPQQDEEDDDENFQMKKPSYKRTSNLKDNYDEDRPAISNSLPQKPKAGKDKKKPRADDDESLDAFLEGSD